jgi:hypothetical protein
VRYAIRLEPDAVETEPAAPLGRGTELAARPLRMRSDGPQIAAKGVESVPAGAGDPNAVQTLTEPLSYCTGCGHDRDRHRRGRCWTDALGAPVTRARTHIDCTCREDQP